MLQGAGGPKPRVRSILQWKGDNYAYLIIYYGHFDVLFFPVTPFVCSLSLSNVLLPSYSFVFCAIVD